ncbi:MAG TPA: hypothetical protein VE221_07030 [Sphingomicrobium sp.]|nr:hypothetical protein [Sphingomicrobium sp.]
MRVKPLLIASAAVALGLSVLALPVLAQQVPQPTPATPAQVPANTVAPAAAQPTATTPGGETPSDETAVEEVANLNLPPPPPPVEYPGWARRDPWVVGSLDPEHEGLGANPWGGASGAFLSTLMRRMSTPIASRWAHIALRDALLAKARAPRDVNPIDWVAERAWLLLRLGEADAARMLVAGVDTDRFTPKMVQVAVQSALANADPPALCPLEEGIGKYEPNIRALVQAMCSSLAGEPDTAAGEIDDARRHGRVGGIDLNLADKVVGAGANTARAVSIEWDPVDSLTAWRFGLATATGMVPPDRLMNAASPQLRAFQARAPLLTPQQRLPSAFVAAGLGVFSSQSMVDLYSAIYDSTDPDELSNTDVWQLRQAFVGKDSDTRLAAIRHLLAAGKDPLQKEAMRALVARAATRVEPDAKLGPDAPDLISAMLAAGYDRATARWAGACAKMKDEAGDRCWAMVVLAAPNADGLDLSAGRITSFIGRDISRNRFRSALLVAGLAGIGRITPDAANSLNRRYGLGLGRQSNWTHAIDAAAARGQAGTVLVLTGTGFQTARFDQLPGSHVYHALTALERTGQDFTARMIAAEALSRT